MFTYVVQEPRDAKRSVGQERGIMINNTEQFRNMVFWNTGESRKGFGSLSCQCAEGQIDSVNNVSNRFDDISLTLFVNSPEFNVYTFYVFLYASLISPFIPNHVSNFSCRFSFFFLYRPSLEKGSDQLFVTKYSLSINRSVHNQLI